MSHYQYRVSVGSDTLSVGALLDHIPADWSHVCDVAEQRGYYAKLERRLITDFRILPMLADKTGYTVIDDITVICPWEILAEADFIGS